MSAVSPGPLQKPKCSFTWSGITGPSNLVWFNPNLGQILRKNWNKDDGIAESIILEILSEMNERQIQSYMFLLSKDHRKELSSIYETFKNVRKRRLQTV